MDQSRGRARELRVRPASNLGRPASAFLALVDALVSGVRLGEEMTDACLPLDLADDLEELRSIGVVPRPTASQPTDADERDARPNGLAVRNGVPGQVGAAGQAGTPSLPSDR